MTDKTCLQCEKCGGPMYFDSELNAFHCVYCGENVPYDGNIDTSDKELVLDHIPVPKANGCYVLNGLGEEHDMNYKGAGSSLESWEIREDESFFGWKKPNTLEDREKVSFICEKCGGLVEGYGSQNIWECEYCGNKYIKEKLLETGWFAPNWNFKGTLYDWEQKKLVSIDDSHCPIPRYAAPFRISLANAQQRILNFVNDHPKAFVDVDMHHHIQHLRAVYFCYFLCDTTILMTMDMKKGRTLLMKDSVNWAVPASAKHGTELLHDIGPWDLGALKPFVPAFAEGDIWFDRPWGNDDSPIFYRQCADLSKDAVNFTNKLYGCDDAVFESVRTWDRNKVRVYLPAFYLGRPSTGGKFCFAVNGQTGTVSCMGKGKSKDRKTLVKEGDLTIVNNSSEPIIMTPFYTVKKVKGQMDTYQIADAREAYVKKGLFERRKR